MTDKHTPTPWKVDQYLGSRNWIICKDAGSRGQGIDIVRTVAATGNEKANARHIVKCVNYHDRLVTLLKELHEALIEEHPYYAGGAEHDEVERLFNELDTKKESE